MVSELFPFITECLYYGNKFIESRRIQIDNEFWKDVLLSLKSFLEQTKPANWNELLSIPLWYNQHIKVGGSAVFYRSWRNNGVLLINDLLDSNGEILTFNEFQRKFNLRTNFLQFEGFIRSIKDYIFSFRFAHFLYRQNDPLRPYSALCILKYKKGCRYIYDKFITTSILPSSVRKWQSELDLSHQFDWGKIFSLPFKVTGDTNLRWLQVRINHRILGTKYLLSKMNLQTDDRCTFCSQQQETIKHIFWECEISAYFWDGLKMILHDNCGLRNINFNDATIIFGNPNFDLMLNELILLGKRYIYRMKTEGKEPNLSNFRKIISIQYKIDKYNAVKNQTQLACEKKWEKYIDLLPEQLSYVC